MIHVPHVTVAATVLKFILGPGRAFVPSISSLLSPTVAALLQISGIRERMKKRTEGFLSSDRVSRREFHFTRYPQ